ncbi:F-box/kelch-repeat protein At1g51550 [Phragmites australis]|uniref:F-box/kelch-repeat protein At1g51550 n=1 Tax=Phragmites australis TaxID=29695 RepID=UPI002D781936|nr:F-box/kelch-repeat protein At1g51550 [Phragmites australis]
MGCGGGQEAAGGGEQMDETGSASTASPPPLPPIAQLGYDQVLSVLRLLPPEAVLSFAATCRSFRAWASSDALWEALCRRDWGARAAAALAERRRGGGLPAPWRRVYAEVARLDALSARRVPVKGASPRPRASHSLNLVAGWLVLFGGGCEGGRHLDDTWVAYAGNGAGNGSPTILNWQQLASGTPSGRFSHSCTLVGDVLVLFGGITDRGQRLNDTWIGQIICEEPQRMRISWRLLEVGPLAPPPRGAHAACCVDDQFIVIHGGIGLYGSRLGDTWLLDLSNGLRSGIWHQIRNTWPLPPPRSGHSLTWIGGTHMVLFGGRGSEFEVLNDVWLFDISDHYPKWKELKYDLSSSLGEMPFPRVGHSAILALGGKVLVYGGEDSQRRRKDDFWILDIPAQLQYESGSKKMTKRMWKRLKIDGQCPNYRSFHGACVDTSGCCVYILGGMVDGLVHPAEALGLRFDGQLYQVELVLHL